MRALILIASGALTLAACDKSATADNAVNANDDLAAQTISANDTTAIDAVTGDDANMAADVNYTIAEGDNATAEDNAAGNADEDASRGNAD